MHSEPPDVRPAVKKATSSLLGPAVLLLLVTAGALWPVCTFQFTSWGDGENITHNPLLARVSGESLKRIWSRPYLGEYVPLTQTLWSAIAAARTPLDAKWFHSLNLALHLMSSLVVLLLLHRLTRRRWAAWAGAAMFALHPIQVDAIAWASGTKTLLCGFFVIVATWQYIVAATSVKNIRWLSYAISIIAFIAAMLANPNAIVTPIIAIAIDTLVLRRSAQEVVRWSAPLIFLSIVAAVLSPRAGGASNDFLAARPLIAADAIAFYLWKLIWPAKLGIDYGRTSELIFKENWGYVTWIVPVVATTLLIALAKKAPTLAAGGLIFLAGLLPALGIVRFDSLPNSTVANHFVYIAMLGVALMIAQAVTWRRAASVVVIYALIACGAWSYRQTWHWKDSNALFDHALAVNPQSGPVFNALAKMKLDANEPDKAHEYALKATQATPKFVAAHLTLGRANEMRLDREAALAAYRSAEQLAPNNVTVLNALAAALGDTGSFDDAANISRRAIDIDPNSAAAHFTYGTILENQTKWADALTQLQRSVEIDPYDVAAQSTLARLFAVTGKKDEAIAHYRAALEINPDYTPAKEGLAVWKTPANATSPATRSSP